MKNAVEESRLDIYLQPMVTLPQRKVRFYEAVTRLRDDKDQILAADDFIAIAEAGGLIGKIDHMVMLRCIQGVLRRLMVRNKDVGVFCNVSAATLAIPPISRNASTSSRPIGRWRRRSCSNSSRRRSATLGPTEIENLAALSQRGYRFSIDHVTDLRIKPARPRRPRRPLHQGAGGIVARSQAEARPRTSTPPTFPTCSAASAST